MPILKEWDRLADPSLLMDLSIPCTLLLVAGVVDRTFGVPYTTLHVSKVAIQNGRVHIL